MERKGIRRIRLGGDQATVLIDKQDRYLLYGKGLPELLDIEVSEPLETLYGELFGPDPHPPLTQEQVQVAERLAIRVCRRPNGDCFLSPGTAVLALLGNYRQTQDSPVLLERLRLALDWFLRLVPRYGYDQRLLAFYLYHHPDCYQALTRWLLELPEKGFLALYDCKRIRDGHLEPSWSAELPQWEEPPSVDQELRYALGLGFLKKRPHWVPPSLFCRFHRYGDQGYMPVWLSTSQPRRFVV
ncbi:MAG: hypothetical protein NZ482_03645 [Gloeomargarita sp. SKYG98]|nr:hypothetical protein [Gloeomargarita sp. SKYG98]